jgi:hypothetical protein
MHDYPEQMGHLDLIFSASCNIPALLSLGNIEVDTARLASHDFYQDLSRTLFDQRLKLSDVSIFDKCLFDWDSG